MYEMPTPVFKVTEEKYFKMSSTENFKKSTEALKHLTVKTS